MAKKQKKKKEKPPPEQRREIKRGNYRCDLCDVSSETGQATNAFSVFFFLMKSLICLEGQSLNPRIE